MLAILHERLQLFERNLQTLEASKFMFFFH